jgi:hypothetical protein
MSALRSRQAQVYEAIETLPPNERDCAHHLYRLVTEIAWLTRAPTIIGLASAPMVLVLAYLLPEKLQRFPNHDDRIFVGFAIALVLYAAWAGIVYLFVSSWAIGKTLAFENLLLFGEPEYQNALRFIWELEPTTVETVMEQVSNKWQKNKEFEKRLEELQKKIEDIERIYEDFQHIGAQ